MILQKNQEINFDDGSITVIDLIAEGGQGEVYQVSYQNRLYAFKIFPILDNEERCNTIDKLINKSRPNDHFIWPLQSFVINDDYYAYLMDLLDEKYHCLYDILYQCCEFKSLSIKIKWCLHLVQDFKLIHELGYSYKDISGNNIYADINTGDIMILDVDNINPKGVNDARIGTSYFMAPELYNHDEYYCSDVYTDRFSIALVLFYILCGDSPFENLEESLTEGDFIKYYGNPTFIYEFDKSNINPLVLANYEGLPKYLKDAFYYSFTKGIKDRENRITEIEWIKYLYQYLMGLTLCDCGKEYYNVNYECDKCHKKHQIFLIINKMIIPLYNGKTINNYVIDKFNNDYNKVIMTVIESKNHAKLALKLSLDNDCIIKINNKEYVINHDGLIPIVNNLKIKINNSVGIIKLINN